MSINSAQQQALKQLVAQVDPLLKGLQCYVVGGAVRDTLLGLPVGDRDWVVVGASPEQLAQRGFIPVGGDFPVFLHPRTKEEFALARTERKSGRGYQGFTFYTGPDVSLADDLSRRDLTINALAIDTNGHFYDPLGGYADLEQRVLRHIGEAFIEDPVRLLRLARFAARFTTFQIAAETEALARHLVQNGEVDALVPERVWQELYKGLQASQPLRMVQVLKQCGALERVLPGLVLSSELDPAMAAAVARQLAPLQRFAILCSKSPHPEQVAQHIKAPTAYKDAARLLPILLQAVQTPLSSESVAQTLQKLDSLRKPERYTQLVQAAECVLEAGWSLWLQAAVVFAEVDAATIAQQYQAQPKAIPAAIFEARLAALAAIF